MKTTYKILTICLSFALLFSCKKEDKPEATIDNVYSKVLDLNKPLIRDMYENYGREIYYDFNDTTEIRYNLSLGSIGGWSGSIINHLNTEDVDFALGRLEEDFLQYFKDSFKRILHHRYFIVSSVSYAQTSFKPDVLASESNYEENGYGTAIHNKYYAILAFDRPQIEEFIAKNNINGLNRLKGIKLYSAICYVVEKYNLYSQIPDEFYAPVEGLHGTVINDRADLETNPPVGSGPAASYYDPQWYIDLGMAITANSPAQNITNYNTALRVTSRLSFPNKQRDFRNFLNVILCEPTTSPRNNITKYYKGSKVFVSRMKIVLELLDRWGVDYLKYNPALEGAFLN